MNKNELELIIRRLNKDLGLDREQIKIWLNQPPFKFSNCTPIDYLQIGLFHIIINHIDSMIENKGLYV
jgi:hypothetical protein